MEAVLPHLPRHIAAIVRILLYTGARPSEVLNLKRVDVNTNTEVWSAIIRQQKTAHKDKQRRLFFGPRAQTVLRPTAAPGPFVDEPEIARKNGEDLGKVLDTRSTRSRIRVPFLAE